MENFERCLRVNKKMCEIRANMEALKEEIRQKGGELETLKKEATKAAVLEDKTADRLSLAANDKAAEIERLKYEIEERKEALPLLERELEGGLRIKALDDIRAKYGESYAAAARAFFLKLKEAEKIEEKLISIYQEAEKVGNQIGGGRFTVLPYLGEAICFYVDDPHGGGSPMKNFQRDCECAGIRLS